MAFTMSVAELIEADTSGLLGKHSSWQRVRLGEISSILNGAPFDSAFFGATEGMPLIRIRDVVTGETSTYYSGPYEDVYLVQRGDLLVGMDGDFNSGFWSSDSALLNQRVCKISPIESFYDKRLLAFALPGYLAAINANTPSVTVKHLSSKTIGEIELPLPPRAEQTRIVAKLEELLSDLDAGVAELEAAQKKLQQYRQSLLKAAVEGALTADWREAQRQQGTPTETGAQLLARILNERRARWEAKQLAKFKEQGKAPPNDWQKKYPEPERPDGTKLPSLPEGWVWTSVDQLSPNDLANGRSVPSAEGGAKVLRLTAVRNGLIDLNEVKGGEWTQDEAKPFAVEKGDLLIVRGNGSKSLVGRAGLVGPVNEQVAYPDTLIRLRVCEAVVSSRWVALVWGSEIVRSHLERRARTSAGIYKISQPDIVSARIPVPPIKEAIQALERLESQLELVADLERTVGRVLQQSSGQRQNVLRCAFAGHLVPQDPNDEPASVLLARTRVERSGCASQIRARKTKKYAEA